MKNPIFYSGVILLIMILNSIVSIAQPVVVSQPLDASICIGENVSFNIIAINTTFYQWQEHDGNAWYDINESVSYCSGENTPDLYIIDANVGLNGYKYRCYIKDEFMNSDTSLAATLFVNDIPVLISNPQNTTVCRDEIATFNVEVDNITYYQWQENNESGWQDLSNNAFYQGVHSPDLSVYTVTGMNEYQYKCILYNNSCHISSGIGILYVNALPAGFNLTGGGAYCQGEDGVQIGLSGSEVNINYELLFNEASTGIVLQGTGLELDFGIFTEEGLYSINAINAFTACTNKMNGTTEVEILLLPEIFNITGGGDYCEEGNGIEIGLDNSEIDIQYELFLDGETTGVMVLGTGNEISFDFQTAEGNYAVLAISGDNVCSNEMEGIAEVIINDIPLANSGPDLSVLYGTSIDLFGYASGGSGNYSYSWSPSYLFEDPNVQNPITVNLTSTSIITLTVVDELTDCISHPDTIIVSINGGPLQLSIIANPENVCNGTTSNLLALASGGTGSYEYEWVSNPIGFTSNENNPIVFPEQTTQYFVTLSDGIDVVSDSIIIIVNNPPEKFNITGGGYYCNGDDGVTVGLDDSELDIFYELFFNVEPTGLIQNGTGVPLDFGKHAQNGKYQIFAFNNNSGCESLMNDSVTITNYPALYTNAGDDQVVPITSSANLNGFSYGGSGEFSYLWIPGYMFNDPYIQDPTTVSLSNSALFLLETTDQNTGCISQADSVFVFVSGGNLSLEILAVSNYVCDNDSMKIIVIPSGGSGNYTYLWTSEPSGFSSSKMDTYINPNETTTYYVTVDDGINSLMDSITIYVNNSPVKFNIIGEGGYCAGSEGVEISLDGSQENVIYELYFNNFPTGITLEGNGGPLFFEKQTTTGYYSIFGKYISSYCETQMEGFVNVFIYDFPIAFSVSGDNVFCAGSNGVNIGLSSSQIGINYELILNNISTGILIPGTGLPIVFSNQTSEGVYSINAVNQISLCSKMMYGFVDVVGRPSPNIIASNDTSICSGNQINISAESDEDNFIWNTLPPSYLSNITVSPFEDTIYRVFTFNEFGCNAYDQIEVNVSDSPEVFVEHNLNNKSIYVDPPGYNIYEFIINNEVVQSGSSNEYFLPESIRSGDTIFVNVKNIFNCWAEDFIKIVTVENINAFSPDGDGINDVFMKETEIVIFNRWGLKLYEGVDGWDGKFNGKLVAPDTYYYVHNLQDINGEIIRVIKGSVTVVRQ